MTVVCPVSPPRHGLRRLRGHAARVGAAPARPDARPSCARPGSRPHGFVVETDPVDAVRDALAQLEPRSTRSSSRRIPSSGPAGCAATSSSRSRKVAGDVPVEHVVVDLEHEGGEANVLVIANETVLGEPLLERIRERAQPLAGELPDHLPAERSRAGRASRGGAAAAARAGRAARRGDRRRTARSRTPTRTRRRMQAVARRARRRDHRLDLPGRDARAGCGATSSSGCARTRAAGRARRVRRGARRGGV